MFKRIKTNSFLPVFITAILFLFPLKNYASSPKWNIEVKGIVTEKGHQLMGSVVSLFADSTLKQKITSDSGEFDFILNPDTDYMLTFTKPGYITKCISFSTKNVPAARAKQGFSPYDIEISIYPKIDGVDVNPLLQAPLAMVRYDANMDGGGDFAYDEKYMKSIRPFLSILDYEMKQAVSRAKKDKEDALKTDQLKRQQLIIYASIAILLLVLGFAVYAYRSSIQKKKINKELDMKNRDIEERNREITDSINYARRIQHAIMPEHSSIVNSLPDSFILFKPKAIVSGDFYFYFKDKERTFIAAADCTGHGVPGAFMSLIGYEKLHDATAQTAHTGEVLSMVNKGIRAALRQTSDTGSTRDGMDIALCALEAKNGGMQVSYSGANRPLWIIRKDSNELEEIKPTKKAIGGFTDEEQIFDAHDLHVKKGDAIYMFSDGYADQFGGAQGKKLTTKRFREFLLEIKNFSMAEQYQKLDTFIESWRNREEQLDDILVIGIRV
jgi:serine phosphatase RsbU (regulator of sigma subunit)